MGSRRAVMTLKMRETIKWRKRKAASRRPPMMPIGSRGLDRKDDMENRRDMIFTNLSEMIKNFRLWE